MNMSKKPPLPDWLAQTQCEGKHRFPDASLAKKVAHQSSQRNDSHTSAYRCATCGGWHVGSGRTVKKTMKEKTYMNHKFQERQHG